MTTGIEERRKLIARSAHLSNSALAELLEVSIRTIERDQVVIAASPDAYAPAEIETEPPPPPRSCGYCERPILDSGYEAIENREVHNKCAADYRRSLKPPVKIDPPVKVKEDRPVKKLSTQMARHERGECVDCGKTDDLTIAGRYQCAGCRIRRAEWRRKRKERLAAQQ